MSTEPSSPSESLQDKTKEELIEQVGHLSKQLEVEKRRNVHMTQELKLAKEHTLAVQKQVEQEEEYITNKLIKRLEQLKHEKHTLSTEVERQESYLINTLQKRFDEIAAQKACLESQTKVLLRENNELEAKMACASQEKANLENQLEAEQEYIVNKLQKKLEELSIEKYKLSLEKVDLENQLEAEQEYIVNKLQKQVDRLGKEKRCLQREKTDLQKQVGDLALSLEKLNQDKVKLENQMEMEEEHIVNRLQRQLEHITTNYKILESKLESLGVPIREVGLIPMEFCTEWVYGRSPGKGSDPRWAGVRRERTYSLSSTSSMTSGRDLTRTSIPSTLDIR